MYTAIAVVIYLDLFIIHSYFFLTFKLLLIFSCDAIVILHGLVSGYIIMRFYGGAGGPPTAALIQPSGPLCSPNVIAVIIFVRILCRHGRTEINNSDENPDREGFSPRI